MENVLQIHTEAVSAQIAHFYEVCIRIIALLGPVERQTPYKRLTYFTSQLPFKLNSTFKLTKKHMPKLTLKGAEEA